MSGGLGRRGAEALGEADFGNAGMRLNWTSGVGTSKNLSCSLGGRDGRASISVIILLNVATAVALM